MSDLLMTMLVGVVLVLTTSLIHYEALRMMMDRLPKIDCLHGRAQVLVAICGVFVAHTLEVWCYAFGYAGLSALGFGALSGEGLSGTSAFSWLYYSAVSYTSLGLGDVFATGSLRLLTGIEALHGLVLIGWSAAFTYWMMSRVWEQR